MRLLLLLVLSFTSVSAQDVEPRRLEVLFLGDNGHHKPLERYRVLKRALGTRGYNITWVEGLENVTRDRLDRYDSVIVYANYEKNEVPQALLQWVRDGGALVALHSACGCFHHSPEWFEVVGGRFKSHGGAVFSPENVDKEHVITKELPKLEAWDETYVHQLLAEDRHVLQVRPPVNKGETEPEPWTWLRTEGKGRVFYTASGHDLRVWNTEAYQELVARGIVWSVGSDKAAQFKALKLPALETEVPDLEGRAHPEIPMMEIQKPLSAEDSALHTQVPAGTRLELFAEEPMVINPIAIDWDERGRCWVVESFGYPNDVPSEPEAGKDKIKILEDTDGDGKADKMTVFADKLRHCTTSVFVNGGIIATDGSDIVFLKDTDGDDVADERKVLAGGIKMFDTHASVSHFLYGMDNWIYGVVGYSGVNIKLGDKAHNFQKAVFRFKPDMSELEYLQGTTNNTWGLGFSVEGDVFGSTANNNPSWEMSIPKAAYEGSGLKQPNTPRMDKNPYMFTNTLDITQVDQIEQYTAAAGHMLYNDKYFEGILNPDTAFICEPTGHIVAIGEVSDQGARHSINMRGNNIFCSADAWSAPVAARPGPDGAIWVADWYNPIIQHNVVFRFWNPARGYDYPHSPYHVGAKKPGKGNAYVTPMRDRKHGRIWRVVPEDEELRKPPVLSKDDSKGLFGAMESESQHVRLHAQRLLVEKGDGNDILRIQEIIEGAKNEGGMPISALHAVRVLQGINEKLHKRLIQELKLNPQSQNVIKLLSFLVGVEKGLGDALESPNVYIRRQAMHALKPDDPVLPYVLPKLLKNADTSRDRMLVFSKYAVAPLNQVLAKSLWDYLLKYETYDETELAAARLAMRRQGSLFIAEAIKKDAGKPLTWVDRELDEIMRMVALGGYRPALEAMVKDAPDAYKTRITIILSEKPPEKSTEQKLSGKLRFGRNQYMQACVECHQADGNGVEKIFPPLTNSEWVKGDQKTMLRIMLGGLSGPITVNGVEYKSVMPGHSHASDDHLAAIASYVRYQFGGLKEDPVDAKLVEELRPEIKRRKYAPWTVEELEKKR